jgi:uncharacterized protein YciI
MYFLAINRLKVGANPEGLASKMPEHQEWIADLVKKKIMIQAGKWGTIGSAFLFKAENIQKAHAILAQDPLMLHDMVDYQMHEFMPEVEIKA